jgi:hypothetical protein
LGLRVLPIVASVSVTLAGGLIIGGGIVTLIGAVATIAGLTPEYKELGWDDKAQGVGYLLGVPGVAAVFAGTTLEITSKSPALIKFEAFGAAIVAASVVVAFALPIASRAKGKRAAKLEQRRRADASRRSPPP